MAGAPLGNTNGKKENRLVTDALRRAVAQNPDKLQLGCMKVLDDAVGGNIASFSVIADRLDGKPAQSVTLRGDEDAPVAIKEVALVRPSPTE
jgi:hypothetical protein